MKPDVVVVGAGLIGLSVAVALQQRGLKVLVVDGEAGFAQGTSGVGSFAWLNATAKTDDRRYHDLNRAGMAAYAALADEWGEAAVGLSSAGSLHVSRGAAGPASREALRREFDVLAGWRYPVRWLDAAALAMAEPVLAPLPGDAAFIAVDDRWLDTRRFLAFQRARLLGGGGELRLGHIVRRIVPGAAPAIETDSGRIEATNIVLAVGAATPALLGPLWQGAGMNRPVPVRAKPGLLVETEPLPAGIRLSQVLHVDDDHWLHARPTPDGGLLVASDDGDADFVAAGEAAVAGIASRLLTRLSGYLRPECGAALRVRRHFIGIRPVPEDGQPIAGPVEAAPGIHLVATHSGATLALHLAALVAAEIAGAGRQDELAPFRLGRFI